MVHGKKQIQMIFLVIFGQCKLQQKEMDKSPTTIKVFRCTQNLTIYIAPLLNLDTDSGMVGGKEDKKVLLFIIPQLIISL